MPAAQLPPVAPPADGQGKAAVRGPAEGREDSRGSVPPRCSSAGQAGRQALQVQLSLDCRCWPSADPAPHTAPQRGKRAHVAMQQCMQHSSKLARAAPSQKLCWSLGRSAAWQTACRGTGRGRSPWLQGRQARRKARGRQMREFASRHRAGLPTTAPRGRGFREGGRIRLQGARSA